jgi:hypothetical protein
LLTGEKEDAAHCSCWKDSKYKTICTHTCMCVNDCKDMESNEDRESAWCVSYVNLWTTWMVPALKK